MSGTLIKICGLTDEDGVDAAVEAGVDMIGFVFFDPSPRDLDPARAAELLDGVPHAEEGGPLRVGLFVDADDATLEAVFAGVRLDVLQFHGEESPERVEWARLEYGLPVIKALPIASAADLERAALYAEVADYLLFDARPPAGADRPGGHAQTFDWSLLAGFSAPVPWLLAGGLTPENVAEAIRVSGATAVDVSSGVETVRGIKDPERVGAFVKAVREG
ncbi:phosphoribosylanthranilate isomerase [Rhodospirillum rubrum]|uniref:phosphoribosylanthranilate isomerase n=1 Tax=Rhodospirillum rubrum TaxID=1085 RepID=UPI001908946B|nr:phosphoribosylanthranilate isomerase [Rhodospirillum rubrum]MBK1665823.1 phosphoribosylanthranilate isomerase [Rhodospirillum rubrum]MBK1678226.1 phosphoribosylanthranilate isomerase [Rhodospirillum rubrum]